MYNAEEFKSRGYTLISDSEMDVIRNTYKEVSYNPVPTDKDYHWETVVRDGNDIKYGRIVVCHKHKVKRGQTMGEFYGGGVVD